jgi:hypothetical protein
VLHVRSRLFVWCTSLWVDVSHIYRAYIYMQWSLCQGHPPCRRLTSEMLFGLLFVRRMTCFNLFLKALWGFYAFEYMTAQGGDPLMLLQPSG